jgi:tetratricopeptide (TPR) repeat protein
MKINTIVVTGEKLLTPLSVEESEDLLELESSYKINGTTRGLIDTHTIKIENNRIVELVFEDSTNWICNSDTLDEVFPEATLQQRSIDGAFHVPTVLKTPESQRGIVGDIALKVLNVFTKKEIGKETKAIASNLEKKQLENYSGLYRIDSDFKFQKFEPDQTNKPYLIFLHGTSSSTKGSFGELVNSELWKYIYQNYGNNVLAFQHESLTKSPLLNAYELIKAFPSNIALDIISHSRGGLIGDILCRYSNTDENNRGFDQDEIAYLKKLNREDDLEKIELIRTELKNKKFSVNKFIRVACPASGTTLASKRLDNFFNVTFNLIGYGTGIAANPFYSIFKDLTACVIDGKNNVDVLPGIEAMNPDSAFIKVLNSPNTKAVIDRPLIVISGNCKLKANLKALIVIASKLFYLRDNDLVVNTRSMYQGARRSRNVQYFFNETTDVDHFHYFKNKETSDAMLVALKASNEAPIPGFIEAQQVSLLDSQRNAILKLDGGQVFTNTVTGTKPIVVLLPGIMGSNLSEDGQLIWVNYFRFIEGQLTRLDIKNDMSAPSLISTSYKKIVDYLSPTYDVITFPFDWRIQLNAIAGLFNDKIIDLLQYKQPIKIVAHSMGGVMMRDFIISYPDTWRDLNHSRSFKLAFLGAPLGGSFRIPAVLFGKDAIIDKLSKIDIFHTKEELLNIFSKLPGLLSLLPLNKDKDNDFSNEATWLNMKEALGVNSWPVPIAKDLNTFQTYRDNIYEKLEAIDYTNIVYIAGKDNSTPCGYRIDDTTAGKELVFLSTAEGDQSVTWESGIPKKMIEQNRVYYVNVSHGALANEPLIFKGIADLIADGTTSSLSKVRPAVRGEEKVFRTPEQRDFDLSPAGIENTLLGLTGAQEITPAESAINISVSNGDLLYSSFPVLGGHFKNDGITSAEDALDKKMRGALSKRHRLGLYPGEIGSSEVILYNETGFKGAVIVGLGNYGDLSDYQLSKTIEQGVSKFLLDVNSIANFGNNVDPGPVGISTLVIGSGYGGLSVENSIRAIIQGVQNANIKIKKLQLENFKTVEEIEFIELYEDRALNCFYCLSRIENEQNNSLRITINRKGIKTLFGSKKRIPSDTMEGWWTRITVQMIQRDTALNIPQHLQFSTSTGGARDEQRNLFINPAGIENLINDSSVNNQWSPILGKTLFEMLIPLDFKERLKNQCNINWIVDKYTAAFPWELLQDNVSNGKPLSVNAGMVRQLNTEDYRLKINSVNSDNALIIADPELNGFISQLDGAFKEGQLVSKLLSTNSFAIQAILKGSSSQILQSLYKDDYKIIHLAGHGTFNENDPQTSGMVIGKNDFLSTFHIAQMSTVPELVFVNCCYLGKTEGIAEELYQDRYKLAANIGTQLIQNGVKAVVVAGWAVNDGAALDFTKVFYEHMFNGYTFGGSIQEARKLIFEKYKEDNTWGAYQCYGDPFYKFRNNMSTVQKDKEFVIPEEAEIELDNLQNELKTGQYSHDEYLEKLSEISKAADKAGIRNAAITEKEALIYSDLYEYELAISKFEELLSIEKASFSVSTLEKYCNIRMKKYVYDFIKFNKKPREADIKDAIDGLISLLKVSPTAERFSLLGSAYKRRGILTSNESRKIKAYAEAAYYYMKADSLQSNSYTAYTTTNWLELESILMTIDKRRWNGIVEVGTDNYILPSKEDAIKRLEVLNKGSNGPSNMDYWDMIIRANIELCSLFVNPASDEKADNKIIEMYRNVWTNAGSMGDKFAEVEHLEILIDAISISKKKNVNLLKKIETLKAELEKLI